MANGTITVPLRVEAFDYAQWRTLTEKALTEGERRLGAAHEAIARATADVARLECEMGILRRALALEPEAPVALPPVPPTVDAGDPEPEAVTAAQPVYATSAGDLFGGHPLPPVPIMVRGSRDGSGVGGKAAAFLLEVARIRVRVNAGRRQPHVREDRAPIDLALDGEEALTPEAIRLSCRGWSRRTAGEGLRRLVEDGHLERTAPGVFRLTPAGLAVGPAPAGTLPLSEPTDPTAPREARDAAVTH